MNNFFKAIAALNRLRISSIRGRGDEEFVDSSLCCVRSIGRTKRNNGTAPKRRNRRNRTTTKRPHEPGSVLVFPKFLRGTVQTESGVQPKTEIEISIRCPKSQPGQTVTCPDAGQTVNLRAHWVCPSGNVFAPCLETDFNLNRTVHGTLYFNPEVPFP